MQKKLIALAIASAFAAPAFAATSNVEVGGGLNLSVDYIDGDQRDQDGQLNVSSNASTIYFRGSEDLGGGLKALWQIQTYFSVGGTGNADTGVGEAVKDGVSSGNTFVGLSGGFGKALLGKHEAPMKLVGRKVDLFGDQLGDNRNLLTKPNGKGVSWDLRPNNAIIYATPRISGFGADVAYVTNVGESDAAGSAGADDSTTAWSASVEYLNGPLELRAGYQKHEFAAPNVDEKAWRLSAAFTMGGLKMVGVYQDMNADYAGGDVTTWGLGAAYKMGNITLKTQYYQADDADGTTNTGADMWAVGVDYAMSKRTTLYAAYATTDNDTGAKYSMAGGGHGDNPGTTAGGNPNGFQIGVKHLF